MKRFVSVVAFLAALAPVLAGTAALAQGAVCQNLQSQYIAAARSSPATGGGDAASLNRALAAAQQAARANNCSSLGIFAPPPGPACPGINSQIAQLTASLRQSSGYNPFFGYSAYSRSATDQLRDALMYNRCEVPSLGTGGGGRSLCVRTCDGYYFPVSSGGSRADAEVCQATYGEAGSAELFVASGDDVANARSVATNKRYGDQSYAFLYRKAFNPVCAAELQDGLKTLGAAAPATPATPVAATAVQVVVAAGPPLLLALPQPRPRWSEDPETLANATGSMRPAPLVTAVAAADQPAGMRIVGAGYYNTLLELQQQSRFTAPSAQQ